MSLYRPEFEAARRTCLPRRGNYCAFTRKPTWSILSAVSGSRQVANMAFRTFKTKREPVSLEALGLRVERRRAELGEVEVPRNSGKNRTPSKRALLKAIEDAGGKW